MEALLTVREVARALRYADERPVRAAIKRGELRALKRYDGRRLIEESEFARYRASLAEPVSSFVITGRRQQPVRRRAVKLALPGHD